MRSTFFYAINQLAHYSNILVFILLIGGCQSKNDMSGQLRQEHANSHSGHEAHPMPAEENKEVNRLHREVIAIHDELMGKMDELMQLKRKGKQTLLVLDSLSKANPGKENTSAQKQQLKDALQALNHGDEAMMNWMRQYDHAMEGKSEAENEGIYKMKRTN